MNADYKKFLKEAKKLKIDTEEGLKDLVYKMYERCDGGEFECAKKILKIKK